LKIFEVSGLLNICGPVAFALATNYQSALKYPALMHSSSPNEFQSTYRI
jgi:hypothetical protein